MGEVEEVGDGIHALTAVAQLAADVEGRVVCYPIAGAVAAHQLGDLAEVLYFPRLRLSAKDTFF